MAKLCMFIMLLFSLPIYAVTPVVDYMAIEEIVAMLTQLKSQYEKMKEQLAQAELHNTHLSTHLPSLTGENAFSDILNSNHDKAARVWAPDSIDDFENMLTNGFNPGDLEDRYTYYQEKFPAIEADKIDPKNPDSPQRDLYQYNEDWTKLNLAGFAQTFDAVNASYDRINDLLSKTNSHHTLKESSDFSNRILGELAYLLQSLIQVQNFEMHINTMLQQAEQNNIAAHADFFTFRKK